MSRANFCALYACYASIIRASLFAFRASPKLRDMRALILTLMLLCFAAQSLALAVGPACDPGADASGHASMSMAMEAGTHAEADHSNMPCCEDSADTAHQDLCQLTCSVGGCGSMALVAQDWQVIALPATPPFQPISPSPLTASQRNLLRPPIGA